MKNINALMDIINNNEDMISNITEKLDDAIILFGYDHQIARNYKAALDAAIKMQYDFYKEFYEICKQTFLKY